MRKSVAALAAERSWRAWRRSPAGRRDEAEYQERCKRDAAADDAFWAQRNESIRVYDYSLNGDGRVVARESAEWRFRGRAVERIDLGHPADYVRHWELEGPRAADDPAPG